MNSKATLLLAVAALCLAASVGAQSACTFYKPSAANSTESICWPSADQIDRLAPATKNASDQEYYTMAKGFAACLAAAATDEAFQACEEREPPHSSANPSGFMTRVEVQMEECEKYSSSGDCSSKPRSVKSSALGLSAGDALAFMLATAAALALGVAF